MLQDVIRLEMRQTRLDWSVRIEPSRCRGQAEVAALPVEGVTPPATASCQTTPSILD